MFDIETKKKNTKFITNFVKDTMYKYNPNHVLNGFYVLLVHWIACAVPSLIIIFGPINIYFYLSCLCWLCIFGAHSYFKGCIFTRIERELWGDKTWYGPWVFPFKILESSGVDVRSNLSNNIFICWGIIMTILVFLKVLWKID